MNQYNSNFQCPNCKKLTVEYDRITKTYYCTSCKWERDRTLFDFSNEIIEREMENEKEKRI